MQAGANVKLGGVAQFILEADTEVRIIQLPVELKLVLAEDRALRRWYDQLSEAIRKEISDWILQVKSKEARMRRAEQIAERLLLTMEAEEELPPILRVAFARRPLAQKGWEQMSPARRRRHLFSIFYYRSPEGREKRAAKAIEEAEQRAKR